jgi:hypothetical protein
MRGSISFDNAIGVQPYKVSIYSKEEITWLILKAASRSLAAHQQQHIRKTYSVWYIRIQSLPMTVEGSHTFIILR